jgi:hypothetical protein
MLYQSNLQYYTSKYFVKALEIKESIVEKKYFEVLSTFKAKNTLKNLKTKIQFLSSCQ